MLFSWPTGKKNYLASENNWLLASDALKELLGDMSARMDDETTIHLLAHSMGSRVLTQAVRLLREEPNGEAPFGELILAAPDIDAETFRGWADDITPKARRVTSCVRQRQGPAGVPAHPRRRGESRRGTPGAGLSASGDDRRVEGHQRPFVPGG